MNLNEELVKKYIEACLVIHGKINTTMITNMFPCGRQHASRIIGKYNAEFPGTIEYTPTGKGSAYVLVDKEGGFKTAYIENAADFINAIEVVLD